MPKEINTHATVGELIEVLSKYPGSAPLNVFVTETYDDGCTSAAESHRMLIEEWDSWDSLGEIGITFADGYKF